MRTRTRIHTDGLPYYVTVVTAGRRNIFTEPRWALFIIEAIKHQRSKYGFCVFEFVIMPDHYHAILAAPRGYAIGSVMRHINGMFAKRYNRFTGHRGQVFQRDYYDHGIRNEADFRAKAKYIHANPVLAGLVTSPEQYSWSSARNRLLGDNLLIELDDP